MSITINEPIAIEYPEDPMSRVIFIRGIQAGRKLIQYGYECLESAPDDPGDEEQAAMRHQALCTMLDMVQSLLELEESLQSGDLAQTRLQ